MKKTITGKIFIIPNDVETPSNDFNYNWIRKIIEDNFELNVDSDKLVQVWAFNEDCENFSDHQATYLKATGIIDPSKTVNWYDDASNCDQRFPGRLPARILKGIKEGDTITLHRKDNVDIVLTACQSKTRYNFLNCGPNFEDVYNALIGG